MNFFILPLLMDVLIRMTEGSLEKEIATGLNSNQTTLSRRKRYIVFPEGSSFQLVYCLTMPTYQGLSTAIFTMGLTAALAWELPHEPIHFNRKNKEEANKRVDKPNEDRPMSYKTPYTQYEPSKPQYITPHNSLSYPLHFIPIDYQNYRLPAYKDERVYYQHRDVHRRTRRDLFERIEKFFMAQNKDGKACLLKALCEVNQKPKEKVGTFVEEILKAIFTWMPDEIDPETQDLDDASTYKNNCSKKYSECSHSVWGVFV